MSGAAREQLAMLLVGQDEVASSVQLRAKVPSELHLEVEGFGPVTLPVPASQARRLRALGGPARYGRGQDTLTDPAVRDTWEVPRELVRAEWRGAPDGGPVLSPELAILREELGLPEQCRLTADLHSLLVYEKGQFFLPHQDSEKDDAMVATLVVMLPSAHKGGELVVHHLGEETVYRGLRDRISLVAFYADCRHEVRPVTSGYRVVLTYNLLLDGDPSGRSPDAALVGTASGLLTEHFATRARHPYRDTTSEPPQRLAFLLDHEYTEHGLAWPRLKGTDAARASLLRAAADAAGCEAVLALTDIQETWDAYDPDEDEFEGYGPYRRRYQRWDDEEDDSDEAGTPSDDDARYELNSLIESSIRLTWWTEGAGTPGEDVSLSLADAEVCAATPSSVLQPYSSQYEGYMGNWGNTLDRWYRRAAVVVWPRDLDFANRAQSSPSWAMDQLLALAQAGNPDPARAAAATLESFWPAAVRGLDRAGPLLGKALPAALALDDADAAARLVGPFTVETLRRQHMPGLAALVGRYGPTWADGVLRAWYGGRQGWASVVGVSRSRWLGSLPDLCEALRAEGDAGTATARCVVRPAWEGLAEQIGTYLAASPATWQRQQLEDLGEPFAALLRAIAIAEASDLPDRILEFCQRQGDLVGCCVIPALRASAALPAGTGLLDVDSRLAADQIDRVRARLACPVRAEDDWSIELPDGCSCAQCARLRTFLAAPGQRTLEWPLAKDGRSHVHSRIDRAELPVSHVTRRQGRPFTLVLTKTSQLFDREREQRDRDQADLAWLLERQM